MSETSATHPKRGRRFNDILVSNVPGATIGFAVNVFSTDYRWAGFAAWSAIVVLGAAVADLRKREPGMRLVTLSSKALLVFSLAAAITAVVSSAAVSAVAAVVAAGLAVSAVFIRTQAQPALYLLLGAAVIGGGVAEIGYGVDGILYDDAIVGVGWLAAGIASVLLGVAINARQGTVANVAYLLGGIAYLLTGLKLTTLNNGLIGVLLALAGATSAGFGATSLWSRDRRLPAAVLVVAGLLSIGTGVPYLIYDDTLPGVICVCFGLLDAFTGLAIFVHAGVLAGIFGVLAGAAGATAGTVMAAQGRILTGLAYIAGGIAFAGLALLLTDITQLLRRGHAWLTADPTKDAT